MIASSHNLAKPSPGANAARRHVAASPPSGEGILEDRRVIHRNLGPPGPCLEVKNGLSFSRPSALVSVHERRNSYLIPGDVSRTTVASSSRTARSAGPGLPYGWHANDQSIHPMPTALRQGSASQPEGIVDASVASSFPLEADAVPAVLGLWLDVADESRHRRAAVADLHLLIRPQAGDVFQQRADPRARLVKNHRRLPAGRFRLNENPRYVVAKAGRASLVGPLMTVEDAQLSRRIEQLGVVNRFGDEGLAASLEGPRLVAPAPGHRRDDDLGGGRPVDSTFMFVAADQGRGRSHS